MAIGELLARARGGDGQAFGQLATFPARASGALLSNAGLGPGRRGYAAGDADSGVAEPERVPGACVRADLAVPHRDQTLSERFALGQPTPQSCPTRDDS
jgi:hypothetical protein